MRRARLGSALVALALLACVRQAAAQLPAAEEADAFFRRGSALLDAGRLDEASLALARSQALAPSPTTAALLAACDEKRGFVARAYAEYLDAARLAGSVMDKREADFKQRADALLPRVPRLVIKVDPAGPPARVTRGGQEVDADALDHEMLVDPGTIEVVARGEDGTEVRRSVVASVGQSVEVVLPAFAVPKTTPGRRAMRVASYVAGGVGLAGIAVGTGFALGAVARNNDSQACTPTAPTCPARNDAVTAANVATVGWAVGLPATALFAVLFFASRPSAPAAPAAKSAASFSILPGPRGVSIAGTF
jgi:hypothetical protein